MDTVDILSADYIWDTDQNNIGWNTIPPHLQEGQIVILTGKPCVAVYSLSCNGCDARKHANYCVERPFQCITTQLKEIAYNNEVCDGCV